MNKTLRTTILLSVVSMSTAFVFAAPTGTNPRPQFAEAPTGTNPRPQVAEAPTGTNPRPQVNVASSPFAAAVAL